MDTSDMRCLFKPLPLLMDARVRMSTRASPCAPHLYSACMCVGRYIQERSVRVIERSSDKRRRKRAVVCTSSSRDVYGRVYVPLRTDNTSIFFLLSYPIFAERRPPYWRPYREEPCEQAIQGPRCHLHTLAPRKLRNRQPSKSSMQPSHAHHFCLSLQT